LQGMKIMAVGAILRKAAARWCKDILHLDHSSNRPSATATSATHRAMKSES
jgi:hypothetical protein